MPTTGISLLATQVAHRTDKITVRKPWGLLFHTTGGGITPKAKKSGKKPIEVALDWYAKSQGATGGQGANGYPWGGPGYVMDHDGTLYQIANETTWTNHCGGPYRQIYLSGKWVAKCSPRAVAEWHRRWPGYSSPQALFPSKSPNADYIGVEMIPCGDGFGTPMNQWLKFTKKQHDSCIALAIDVAARNKFPKGWERTPRLLGHEDVQLIDRQDKGGGWDPGYLREVPYFDFEYVRAGIGKVVLIG